MKQTLIKQVIGILLLAFFPFLLQAQQKLTIAEMERILNSRLSAFGVSTKLSSLNHSYINGLPSSKIKYYLKENGKIINQNLNEAECIYWAGSLISATHYPYENIKVNHSTDKDGIITIVDSKYRGKCLCVPMAGQQNSTNNSSYSKPSSSSSNSSNSGKTLGEELGQALGQAISAAIARKQQEKYDRIMAQWEAEVEARQREAETKLREDDLANAGGKEIVLQTNNSNYSFQSKPPVVPPPPNSQSKNSDVYIPKSGYDMMVDMGRGCGLNFYDYISRERWNLDVKNASIKELAKWNADYDRFVKDCYGANELTFISEKAKEELIDMGIDIAKIWVSTGAGVAASTLATPVAGMVIKTATSSFIAGAAECAKAINHKESCTDPTILRQTLKSATTAAIKQTINTGNTIGDITIKAMIDAGSKYDKTNSLSQSGKHGWKSAVKQGVPIMIDNAAGNCGLSPLIKLTFDVIDEVTPNVSLEKMKK